MTSRWLEIGDRVFVRRYRFYDQGIVAVLGGDAALVVDTRTTLGPGARDPRRPARPRLAPRRHRRQHPRPLRPRLRQRRVPAGRDLGPRAVPDDDRADRASPSGSRSSRELPALADELAEVVLDPPDRVFADAATLDLGGREIRLAYLGRGHTDNDIVVSIPDADVLCAGDLLENGAPPWFGDGYPMDWPATAERILALTGRADGRQPGARRPRRARRSWRRRWSSSGPSRRWRRASARGRPRPRGGARPPAP